MGMHRRPSEAPAEEAVLGEAGAMQRGTSGGCRVRDGGVEGGGGSALLVRWPERAKETYSLCTAHWLRSLSFWLRNSENLTVV